MQRLDQLEGKRREKEEKDAAREDRKKVRKIEAENPASIMAQVSKHNDPMTYRARTALSLPAPQVNNTRQERKGNDGGLREKEGERIASFLYTSRIWRLDPGCFPHLD